MKLKVLVIGPYPPPYSGPENSMKALLDSSFSERFDVTFLKTNVRTSNDARGRMDSTLVLAFFKFIYRLLLAIFINRPKAAYYYVTATRTGWLGRDVWCILICRALGVPVVAHMRAGHFKRNYNRMSAFERAIIRFACRRVSCGLVQAETLKEQFRGLMKEERIHVVYNSIDTKTYMNEDVTDYSRDTVFFLGHLSHAKGYCDLLAAMPVMTKRHPQVRFLFAGDKIKIERNVFFNEVTGERIVFDDPDECYEKYIRPDLEENHVYLGLIDEEEKMRVFKECNFLVLPSYSEGFSMSVLEALSMGKPVICTPVGALKEIVRDGENGYLVDPGDVNSLVDRMDKLISDEETRNRMAAHNYEYAREKFDIESIVKQIGDHIEAAAIR